ncbi:E3 ubiquitin-protein ligase DTX3L [Elysia marginata]|uniref:E3 ubiquitin-protein ligase n=1 Tax=Elysia marginata TaxID=1093978 RepID=A0AAV4FE08_9GAST|nr:E3 ubiquitin-protein ligase DTX3L [Elysia marginata]
MANKQSGELFTKCFFTLSDRVPNQDKELMHKFITIGFSITNIYPLTIEKVSTSSDDIENLIKVINQAFEPQLEEDFEIIDSVKSSKGEQGYRESVPRAGLLTSEGAGFVREDDSIESYSKGITKPRDLDIACKTLENGKRYVGTTSVFSNSALDGEDLKDAAEPDSLYLLQAAGGTKEPCGRSTGKKFLRNIAGTNNNSCSKVETTTSPKTFSDGDCLNEAEESDSYMYVFRAEAEADSHACPPKTEQDLRDSPPKTEQDLHDSPPITDFDLYDSPPRTEKDQNDCPPKTELDSYDSPPKTELDSHYSPPLTDYDSYDHPPKTEQDSYDNPPKTELNSYDSPPKTEQDLHDSPPKTEQDSHDSPTKTEQDQHESPPKPELDSHDSPPITDFDSYDSPPKTELGLQDNQKPLGRIKEPFDTCTASQISVEGAIGGSDSGSRMKNAAVPKAASTGNLFKADADSDACDRPQAAAGSWRPSEVPTEECGVCLGDMCRLYPLTCCDAVVCTTCAKKLHRCPFCRKPFVNVRGDQAEGERSSRQPREVPTMEECGVCLNDKFVRQPLACCNGIVCITCAKKVPRCPFCRTPFVLITGNQPRGRMKIALMPSQKLKGYEEFGSYTITYCFPSGRQGPEHPDPGETFAAVERKAYLPATTEGNKVLRLLRVAFLRRLTFTIGVSLTTGKKGVITWNGILHKTSLKEGNCYGYPDCHYLWSVTEDLADLGVDEESFSEEESCDLERVQRKLQRDQQFPD